MPAGSAKSAPVAQPAVDIPLRGRDDLGGSPRTAQARPGELSELGIGETADGPGDGVLVDQPAPEQEWVVGAEGDLGPARDELAQRHLRGGVEDPEGDIAPWTDLEGDARRDDGVEHPRVLDTAHPMAEPCRLYTS